MEFVQFFPIGHLAPRLIGMDPIMWDPFRYKLGGRLLNSELREFTDDYGVPEAGSYRVTRDLATYAILKEVEAGRGSPAGGVYLSFRHVPADRLREAFGPVIDRLAKNGIDLTRSRCRGCADRALSHGRHPRRTIARDAHRQSLRRRRGDRRRQRRQPPVGQRDHRGAGIRPDRRRSRRRARQAHRRRARGATRTPRRRWSCRPRMARRARSTRPP